MKNCNKFRIIYLVQLPPPVHGVGVINSLVYSSSTINQGLEKKLIEIKFSKEIKELRKISIKKLWIFIKTWFNLFFTLIYFRPDLVYFSLMPVGKGFLRDACFAFLIKLFPAKVIYHLHNRGIAYYNQKIIYRWLYKRVFNHSTIIHVSEGLLSTEINPLKLKDIRTFAVENTIVPVNIKKSSSKKNTINILFLSNYFPEKGLMVLLEAIHPLIKKYPNIILNTYGATQDKEEIKRYKKFISYNDLNKNIFIHGPVYGREKIRIFEKSDLYVFPSYFEEECFPLAILEAMNAKLPIIASKIGAIPEILTDGVNGILIPQKNVEILKKNLLHLIKNKEKCRSLGQKASEDFNKYFSLFLFENKMKNIFSNFFHKQDSKQNILIK